MASHEETAVVAFAALGMIQQDDPVRREVQARDFDWQSQRGHAYARSFPQSMQQISATQKSNETSENTSKNCCKGRVTPNSPK